MSAMKVTDAPRMFLLGEPLRVGLHVDHRHRAAELKLEISLNRNAVAGLPSA